MIFLCLFFVDNMVYKTPWLISAPTKTFTSRYNDTYIIVTFTKYRVVGNRTLIKIRYLVKIEDIINISLGSI